MAQQRSNIALVTIILTALSLGLCLQAAAQEKPRTAAPRAQPLAEDSFAEAKKMLELGRYPRAVTLLTAVINRGEHLPHAYSLRGIAYDRMGLPAKAVKDLSDYIARKPSDPRGYLLRGDAQNFNLDHDAALKDYTKAIELAPKSAEAHLGRGLAHAGLGRYDDAIKDYRAALVIDPKNAEAMANMGRAFMLGGRNADAIRSLEKALQHETTSETKKQIQEWLGELRSPAKGKEQPSAAQTPAADGPRPGRLW